MSNEQEIECFNAFCEWYGCNKHSVWPAVKTHFPSLQVVLELLTGRSWNDNRCLHRANSRGMSRHFLTGYDRITQMCWQAWRKSWASRFTTVSPTGDA